MDRFGQHCTIMSMIHLLMSQGKNLICIKKTLVMYKGKAFDVQCSWLRSNYNIFYFEMVVQQLHGHLKLRAKKSKDGDTFVSIRWGKMPVDKLTIFPCQDLKYTAMLMEFVMILVRLYSGLCLDMIS